MKLSLSKSLAIIVALLAMTLSSIGVMPAYAIETFANRTTVDGLGSNTVFGVTVNGSKIYLATQNGLSISTDSGNTFTNKTVADGLADNCVQDVWVGNASGSLIYAATNKGLSISTNGGTSFVTAEGLKYNDAVFGIFVSGNKVYAATNGGLAISTDGGYTFLAANTKTTTNGLGSNWVRGVFVSSGVIYAATSGGLSISTDGGITFVNRTTVNGLANDLVFDVLVYGSRIYAATKAGLSISTNGGDTFSTKTIVNGLGSNVVYDIFVDGANVYAATLGGLSVSTDGAATFYNYTPVNGLGKYDIRSVFVDTTTARIYAGTNGGGLSISGAVSVAYRSIGTSDGSILESAENSNVGGTKDATSTTFKVGDNETRKQYRAILQFNVSLPSNAIIASATLKIKRQSLHGSNPFSVLNELTVDLKKSSFGAAALELSDFSVLAGQAGVATFNPTPNGFWYNATLNRAGKSYINKAGATQFRLYFTLDDNNNSVADYMQFYSGNYATVTDQPALAIIYYLP